MNNSHNPRVLDAHSRTGAKRSRARAWLALLLATTLAACGSTLPPDGGVSSDAGPVPDAGLSDAGLLGDAGLFDAGFRDAGGTDAGLAGDAGLLADGGALDGGALDGGALDGGAAPYGLTERPTTTTCRFPGTDTPLATIEMERAFPNLTFSRPVFLTHTQSGADRIFVVEQDGRVLVFPNRQDAGPADVMVFLDIRARVQCCNEEGLLSIAFHPEYARNRTFYAYYTARYGNDASMRRSVIARFQTSATDPDVALDTGTVILEIAQPYSNHNGGQLLFGPDGYLYIGMGDGGSAGDPGNRAQNMTSLHGKVLRIDVDRTEGALAYAIPADNPFRNTAGARAEIWALGLRNPWRMSFDRVTGTLWTGDVGQNNWEEVDIITRGANYGWRRLEGNVCYNPSSNCQDPSFTAPVAVYQHTGGACSVTGGYVVRGGRVPELLGAYVYADYCSGDLWALRHDGTAVTENRRIGRASGLNPTSFGEDRAGEVYLVAASGTLHRFRRPAAPADAGTTFPRTLSATGCYADLANKTLAQGLVPYDLNAPLWSDGAEKRRFVYVPMGQNIIANDRGGWNLPSGSIIVKEFWLDARTAAGVTRRYLETRFLLKRGTTLEGYTYRWNAEGTDGTLLTTSLREDVSYNPADGGAPAVFNHYYPSRDECLRCHTTAAGGTLGLQTAQLNRDFLYPNGVTDNQLRALEHAGYFGAAGLPATPANLPRLTDYRDARADLAARARAYLHSNCASCHLPGGGTPVAMDLRFDTPFAQTGTCSAQPLAGDLGVSGADILKPGGADASVLYLRMTRRDETRMPPLASSVVDTSGAALLRDWIQGVRCP